jgi:N-acetylmuramoyl-L-alanine amidase
MPGNRRRAGVLAVFIAVAGSIPAATQAPPAPATRFVVVVDAAHGGSDLGGHLNGKQEKDYTLALSVRLRSLLATRGISVVTTRESDAPVDTDRRAALANHANAQACLSLHATLTGSGVHLFLSSLPPAAPGRFTAWKTAQAEWVTRSLALAGTLNSSLLHAGMTVTMSRAALPLIDSMECPAVAVEVAPASVADHASGHSGPSSLDDPTYQTHIAAALAAALIEWRADGANMEAQQP